MEKLCDTCLYGMRVEDNKLACTYAGVCHTPDGEKTAWALNKKKNNGCQEIQLHPVEECQPCPPGIGNKVKATECKCCKCGKQAVAFWPVIDPDIPILPYCRACLDHEKRKAMINILGTEEGRRMLTKVSNQNKADGR